MKNRKVGWLIGGALVAFMAFLGYSTMTEQDARVEVCMVFEGREQCRTATGPSLPEAQRTAVSNACAVLAGGMSASIRCENTPPKSVRVISH